MAGRRGPLGPYKGRTEYGRTTARGYGGDWRLIRLRILDRDGYRCRYCGGYANSVDHVIPRSRGGTSDESNLVAACKPCNSFKRDKAPVARPQRPALPEW